MSVAQRVLTTNEFVVIGGEGASLGGHFSCNNIKSNYNETPNITSWLDEAPLSVVPQIHFLPRGHTYVRNRCCVSVCPRGGERGIKLQ